jgi:hypothetical protein
VAKYQRWVLLAILAQVILNILFISGVLGEDNLLERLLAALSFIIAIFSVYSIYMLARELFSTGIAIACAVLTIAPVAGLIAFTRRQSESNQVSSKSWSQCRTLGS